MLQIKNVSKTYKTGSLTQRALDGVSLNFRDSEFVAVLGQSGSGKTTLLNVIGGLDRADEGELIVNGVSTKKYKSRDWDAYRNHSVGFVFQSYNLIPHQSVLSNVELALTIGGDSKKERRRRAKKALEEVGLSEHIHKKPSQLSGGQMQRVAIARALVNDPDILLADEPTGALDSETSLQVMDLLKEVASDRLVVMVTHNPDLAERYATRTVRLKDGKVIDDTDPYEPKEGDGAPHKSGKAAMSFVTALQLSLQNLWTKKVRTLLVALAGSIGIIGIALILSMSNGADKYIKNIQEDTLKSYPLQITKTSFDVSSLMLQRDATDGDGDGGVDEAVDEVREWRAVTNLFSHVSNNDLKSLREYIEGKETKIYDCVQAIEYDYNVTPQIYKENGDSYRQVNPDRSFAALGFSATDTMSSLMTGLGSTSSFYAMPSDPNLYVGQYDVKAGRWPERYDECVIMLTKKGYIADLTLYTLGLKDPADLDEMVKAFAEGTSSSVDDRGRTYDYDEFIGITFKLVAPSDRFTYDEEYGVWADRSSDEKFMKELVSKGEDIKVVGVVQPNGEGGTPFMNPGIGYPASLTLHVMEKAAESEIVKAQIKDPDTDVFTGTKFGEINDRTFDLSSLFSFDPEAIKDSFGFDGEALENALTSVDMSNLDLSGIDVSSLIDPALFSNITVTAPDEAALSELFKTVKIDFSEEDMRSLFSDLASGFLTSSGGDPSTDLASLPDAMSSFLSSDEAKDALSGSYGMILAENAASVFSPEQFTYLMQNVMAGFPEYAAKRAAEGETDVSALLTEYFTTEEVLRALAAASDSAAAAASALTPTPEQTGEIASSLFAAYGKYAAENAVPDPSAMASAFTEYLSSDEAREIISGKLAASIDTTETEAAAAKLFRDAVTGMQGQIAAALTNALAPLTGQIQNAVAASFSDFAASLPERLEEAFRFDPEALKDAFKTKTSPEELRDLMTSMLTGDTGSYDSNLRKLNFASTDDPSMITVFPTDFEGKTEVKRIIDGYNDCMTAAGEDEKVIVYTDIVDTLMSSVTDIIDAISVILIAFVAVSLVVSSVMIGVITYISVLERKKEIGILRAIGASKRNVSNVFNAETFIIGAAAGVLGIVITYLLLIPANHVIHSLSGQDNINAILPPLAAFLLIVLSIVLTLIGGIIPSRKAARQDPVAALRSE